eukprot:6145986-Amphidinium_carterae.1
MAQAGWPSSVYESLASKFFEHFLLIAHSMTRLNAGVGLWDEEDEFYYDVLTKPSGERVPLKVRSMVAALGDAALPRLTGASTQVGLIPLFAVEVLEPDIMKQLPRFASHVQWLLDNRPDLSDLISHFTIPGVSRLVVPHIMAAFRCGSLEHASEKTMAENLSTSN